MPQEPHPRGAAPAPDRPPGDGDRAGEHAMPEVRPLLRDDVPALGRLFASERSAAACWCMWFVIPVKQFHLGGGAANAALFEAMAASSEQPLGVIAILDGLAAGWAAAGPRSRYARAVRTPTMKGVDHAEDNSVWLVPCLFTRPDLRGRGVARALLEAAVRLAAERGASAVEGFPTRTRTGADRQVGTEALFRGCGFETIARPSSNRVLVRRDLSPSPETSAGATAPHPSSRRPAK
jgi:GNAT superfamily N-acetyltransferase